jgi:hypothetical protein
MRADHSKGFNSFHRGSHILKKKKAGMISKHYETASAGLEIEDQRDYASLKKF